ncbi:gluconate 5-dehydrogenase [Aspergillus nomiae NRRL 13137]|uniref:Gluconate 5-dehydrogenase n=1 Tax=Aspergillus nomiae NRRL (strain ATCC 15546 / NRRL 13137 / CBS 260.88 / M93) TaxID=1509407 RepID=A0A0L1J964_ASPN3|nr:gluconate 5-dehydrogenase [Aspergillus nomiae NRRL 13137]KNG88351.1 gluconate 5-dehydrogenase [Aspergillus nomiae NRRL 13137]
MTRQPLSPVALVILEPPSSIELAKRGTIYPDHIQHGIRESRRDDRRDPKAGQTGRHDPRPLVQAAVKAFGKIDIIVNNAGLADDMPLEHLTNEFWDRMFDTNVRLPAFLVQASLPHLGLAPRIVNISSIAARAGYDATSVYSGSKVALEGLTRAWATELGQRYNATVNCVNPGLVGPVAMDVLAKGDPQVMEHWMAKSKETPAAPRMGMPDDIAQIVAFLCEEGSRWCTGSVVNANGGMVPV